MKKLLLLLLIYGLSGTVYAQTNIVPTQITDQGVQDAISHMDDDIAAITYSQRVIAQETAKMAANQADLQSRQQAFLVMANPPFSIQSVVSACNANAPAHCPGWLINDPNYVNFNSIASQIASGVNWPTISSTSGINWQAIGLIEGTTGINWTAIPKTNYLNWPNCTAQGINWGVFNLNGASC